MSVRIPKIVFLLLVVYAAIHFSYYYADLPPVVASHFDARGVANGWQTKQIFFEWFAGVTALAAALVFAVPALIAVVPVQMVNLPNKRYWLAPDQAEATHRFMGAAFAWFGCGVYVVICYAFDFAVKSNLGAARPDANQFRWVLGGFTVFALAWTIGFGVHFAKVPPENRGVPKPIDSSR